MRITNKYVNKIRSLDKKNGKRRDIIAQAQSGTGKTGAFSIGTLEIIDPKLASTQALILSPTHELAKQTIDVLYALGKFLKVTTQLLVGGTSVEGDKKKLQEIKPQVVVGTPGRVQDMIRRKYLDMKDLKN